MKNTILFFLILALLLSFAGCVEKTPAATPSATPSEVPSSPAPTEPDTLTAEEQAVLDSRRDLVESYMRSMATLLWRAGETVEYYKSNKPLTIVAGRLYRGIPYTHAMGSLNSFVGFGTEQEQVLSVSGLTTDLLGNSTEKIRRIGNDCSASLELSWGQLGADIQASLTTYIAPENGFLRLGPYHAPDDNNNSSPVICSSNGEQVMYRSYALLQKADGVVRSNRGSGHTMMIVTNRVEYLADGTIDGENSYITVLHQTSKYLDKNTSVYDEALGEDVYLTYGVDESFTYQTLFEQGYLPFTCALFLDPTLPIPEPTVTDSLTEVDVDKLFEGEFTGNYFFSYVDITVTDSLGAPVQTVRAFADRNSLRCFKLSEFTKQAGRTVGSLDLSALPVGSYTCTYTATLCTDLQFTPRQFTFTVD